MDVCGTRVSPSPSHPSVIPPHNFRGMYEAVCSVLSHTCSLLLARSDRYLTNSVQVTLGSEAVRVCGCIGGMAQILYVVP